ncbi:hypothetical protein IS519_20470 [Vibrio crassostreae]|uniref:hypothetical protein n=1 Tax=Vibrio crassostreae TaxID=246167 RepID=UPI00200B8B6A|nr:hypothetical protein [Vibrio crassostreae]UPR32899.1 hypothetical protein IS519_20470 [Vibrio crassostreae]
MITNWLANRKNKALSETFLKHFDEFLLSNGGGGISMALIAEISEPDSPDQLATKYVFNDYMKHMIATGVLRESDKEEMETAAKDLVQDFYIRVSINGGRAEDMTKLMRDTSYEMKKRFCLHYPKILQVIKNTIPKFK